MKAAISPLPIIIAILLCNQSANGQIQVTEMKYSHNCSESVTSALTSSPPLQWTMPLPVFQSYFSIDSLCRLDLSQNYQELYSHFYNEITKDFADSISKYLYQTMDYNPLLLYKYIFQAEYMSPNYVNSPRMFYYLFNQIRLNRNLGINPFLAISAGIYHIRVTSVSVDTTYLSPTRTHPITITCVDADVLSSLKGEELTKVYVDPESGTMMHRITFSYAHYWETMHQRDISSSDDELQVQSSVPGIQISNSKTTFGKFHSPAVDDEFVLFAFLHFEPHTSENGTVYNIWPCLSSQPEGGLFPIENGEVLDSSNYFGWSTRVNLYDFLNLLENHIATYLHN